MGLMVGRFLRGKKLRKSVIFMGLHHTAFATQLDVLQGLTHQTLTKKPQEGQQDTVMSRMTVTFFGKAASSVSGPGPSCAMSWT